MRQFGISQHIPTPVDTNDTLHNLNRRGRDNVDWVVKNATWLAYWDDRLAHIAQERFPRTSVGEYMHWYYSITRRIISAPSTDRPQRNLDYAQRGSRIRRVAALALEGAKKAVSALRDALNDSTAAIANNWLGNYRDILDEVGEGHRFEEVIGSDVQATAQHGGRNPLGQSHRCGHISRATDFTMHTSQLTQDDVGPSTTPTEWSRHMNI
ncbi:serine/threonine-protein phosphatase 7 long form homolog [Tripterygium wilfordii]|uniref:serine/threonine-protein phosphatase 7 long form homolog n=1 Tax=Tripterygium wilfordii TaxID=458696 RepID=UPI0018F812D3|nr:serine/threonine-protein phosphatase 7 long form homolog [Tripterygium wilfordii]